MALSDWDRAADPATPPDALNRLLRHRALDVRRRVATNPNASSSALQSLALTFPDEVAANPVLDWLSLEDPDWLASLPARARHRVLMAPGAADGLLWWASRFGDDDDRLAVASNPKCPPALVAAVLDDPDLAATSPLVHSAFAGHVVALSVGDVAAPVPVPLPGDLGPLPGDLGPLLDLLSLGAVAPWLFEAVLAADASVEARRAIARRPDAPAALLASLCVDDDDDTRAAARANPGADRRLTTLLARLDATADATADAHPVDGLSAEELYALPRSATVLRQIASHPALPADVRDACVEEPDWRVRAAVATHPALTVAQLVRLAADHDRDVRAATVAHPALPAAVLHALAHDGDDTVRERARQRRAQPVPPPDGDVDADLVDELLAHGEWGRILAACQAGLDGERLATLSTDESWRVRRAVALNPSAPPALLDALSADRDADVRQAVAVHPATPLAARARLAADDHSEVRRRLAASSWGAAFTGLVEDNLPEVRAAVAANPATGAEALRALAADHAVAVRHAVASRHDVDAATLTALCVHGDAETRQGLLARPDLDDHHLDLLFAEANEPARHRALFRRAQGGPAPLAEPDVRQLLDGAEWAAVVVASMPGLRAGALAFLASHDNWKVRHLVAQRPDTPADLLDVLQADHDYDVRAAVAAHPRTAPDRLVALALDANVAVRRAVAEREDAPPTAVDSLVLDDDDTVRALAAAHPRTSDSARSFVRAMSGTAPLDGDHLERLAAGPLFARRIAARHDGPPQSAARLDRLGTDDAWRVREDVARHHQTAPATVARLAGDPDRDVRAAVAARADLGPQQLDAFTRDSDDLVRRAAYANPALPSGVRQRLTARLLAAAARSPQALNRTVAIASPMTDPQELSRRRHARSIHWLERLALARHPGTPPRVIEQLCEDAHHLVRHEATSR